MIIQSPILIEYFLVFMRVSACFMILPGFSAAQVAVRIRLFAAIGISFSIFMLVQGKLGINSLPGVGQLVILSLNELFIALVLVIPIRFMFLALSFLGEVITQFIGLSPIPGIPLGDDQSSTVLSGLFNVTAVVLFFSTGLHLSFILALANSFLIYPPGELLSISSFVETISINLDAYFNTVVRLGAPVIIYAVILNLIAGLVNKLTPQVPIYFVSTPFLITGGLILLTWIGDDILSLFIREVNYFMQQSR